MTVESEVSFNEYTGNAITTSFPYTFYILDEDHIKVYLGGEVTTAYTVTGEGVVQGGNIVFEEAPASGVSIRVVRDITTTQPQDYVENDSLPAETLELGFDRQIMLMQDIRENLRRTPAFLKGSTVKDYVFPAPTADGIVKFSNDATSLTTIQLPVSTVPIGDVQSYIRANLPSGAQAGAIARVTDSVRGFWLKDTNRWNPVGGEEFDALQFGVKADANPASAAANDTALAAISAALPSGVGGVINLPPGIIYTSQEWLINERCSIRGCASRSTILVATTASQNVIRIKSDESCEIKDLWIDTNITKTAGAGIVLDSSSALTLNRHSKLNNITMVGQFVGIDTLRSFGWIIENSYIVNYISVGVFVRNDVEPDAGDSIIAQNTFHTTVGTAYGVFQESSGGLRIVNNKFLGGLHAYALGLQEDVATSILIIMGNSCESQELSTLHFNNSGGTGQFGAIFIIGNHLSATAATPDSIISMGDMDGIANALIMCNGIAVAANSSGISLTEANNVVIQSNFIFGGVGSEGVGIGAACNGVQLRNNTFLGGLTPYNNASASTIIYTDNTTTATGFYTTAPIAKQTLAAAAVDAATTQALANDIRAKLIQVGLFN